MAISTGLWHRLSNSLPWAFLSFFPSKRGGKVRPQPGFHFMVQKRPVPGSGAHIWLRNLIWRVGMRLIQVSRSLLVVVSLPAQLIPGERGTIGVSAPDVLQSSASLSSSSAVFWIGILSCFLDQWRSITSNRFVLNMVQGHHLQLRSHPPLFCNFW